MTDTGIAVAMGITKGCVSKHRRKLGLAVNEVRFEPTPEQIAQLGGASDREMSRLHGNSTDTWARVRKRYGVAAFRPPTTINGEPNSWVRPEPKADRVSMLNSFWESPVPPRDYSLAGEAATFLRRARFPNVFNRQKVYGKPGWQCGREVLSAGELVEKAQRLGFQREEYMV